MKTENALLRLTMIFLSGFLVLTLAACGGADGTDGDVIELTVGEDMAETPTLADAYDDALAIKNQLLLGTLRLEGSNLAVTAAQEQQLTTLWQAWAALSASGTAAPEETEVVQNQIAAAMTPAQIQAIAGMQLTNADLQAFYVEAGLSEIKTPEPGVTPQSGSMRDLSQEDREATRVAGGMEVGESSGGGSGKSDVLYEMVLELLAGK